MSKLDTFFQTYLFVDEIVSDFAKKSQSIYRDIKKQLAKEMIS